MALTGWVGSNSTGLAPKVLGFIPADLGLRPSPTDFGGVASSATEAGVVDSRIGVGMLGEGDGKSSGVVGTVGDGVAISG
jgi:hypothetical protein